MLPHGPFGREILQTYGADLAATPRHVCIASSRQAITIARNGFVVWTRASFSGMMSLPHVASVESFRSTTSPEPLARTLIEDATEAIQCLGLLSLRTRLFPHWDRGRAQVCHACLRPLSVSANPAQHSCIRWVSKARWSYDLDFVKREVCGRMGWPSAEPDSMILAMDRSFFPARGLVAQEGPLVL